MKITINKTDEMELTEREEKIYKHGLTCGFYRGILFMILAVLITSVLILIR